MRSYTEKREGICHSETGSLQHPRGAIGARREGAGAEARHSDHHSETAETTKMSLPQPWSRLGSLKTKRLLFGKSHIDKVKAICWKVLEGILQCQDKE